MPISFKIVQIGISIHNAPAYEVLSDSLNISYLAVMSVLSHHLSIPCLAVI